MEKKLQADPHSINRAQESENQDQPLHVAIYCAHVSCVQFLLDEGATIDLENHEEEKPLERAVNTRCSYQVDSYQRMYKLNCIIKLLLKHGADIDYSGTEFRCTHFLTKLIASEEMDIFKLFLDYGAKTHDTNAIEEGDMYYETPLYESLLAGQFKVAKLLFLHGAVLDLHKLPSSELYCLQHMSILHQIVKNVDETDEEKYCKILNLYKQFGGDFYVTYRNETALEYLNTHVNERNLDIYSLVEKYAYTPLSLQSICRLTIRSCMGREYKDNIVKLPLPKEVKQFLKFKFD